MGKGHYHHCGIGISLGIRTRKQRASKRPNQSARFLVGCILGGFQGKLEAWLLLALP
ncbi:MAG: hypothetical protein LE179_04945 [Endomicrobium sp.]|nr:hypothetical protein [Endomicrobium sp.]